MNKREVVERLGGQLHLAASIVGGVTSQLEQLGMPWNLKTDLQNVVAQLGEIMDQLEDAPTE